MIQISGKEQGGRFVVEVAGEVDLEVAPRLWREIERALRRSDSVGVRLADVTYIDSSGVAALVQGLKEARQREGVFTLIQPSQRVLAVLQLAQLDRVFPIEGGGADAEAESTG